MPSWNDHNAAIQSLNATFSSNIVFFSAYSNYWMADGQGTFGTEHFWGLFGDAPSGR